MYPVLAKGAAREKVHPRRYHSCSDVMMKPIEHAELGSWVDRDVETRQVVERRIGLGMGMGN